MIDASSDADVQAAMYIANDPEEGPVTWSVEGADGDKFKISNSGLLAFKSKPDFEAKGSAAGTNDYKVTIVASDEAGNRNTKGVKVTVTNVDEPGMIKISTVQPQVNVPLMATLERPGRRSRQDHLDLDSWQRCAGREGWRYNVQALRRRMTVSSGCCCTVGGIYELR